MLRLISISTTEFDLSSLAGGDGKFIQHAGYRRQEILMGLIHSTLAVAVAGYGGLRHRAAPPWTGTRASSPTWRGYLLPPSRIQCQKTRSNAQLQQRRPR